jgi:hypothetical protein
MAADEGGKVFDPNASQAMTGFRKFVEGRWFPLPSNTQFVEAGVKDAKVCATTNRDEMLRSTYAMVRSVLVNPCIEQAIAKRGAILKGNRYMTSGEEGNRKRKRANGVEEDESSGKKVRVQVSGAARSKAILNVTTMIFPGGADKEPSKYQQAKAVMARGAQFDKERLTIKVEDFNGKKDKQRRENIIQKGGALAIMPTLIGKVSINKCNSNKWIPKIKDELTTRNVAFEEGDGLQALKQKLIQNEFQGQNTSNKSDMKFFKPLKLTAVGWTNYE